MSRIELTDDVMSMTIKMSDGNPGAMTAIMEIVSDDRKTDPDCFMGSMSAILDLDSIGIYGTDIYILFSDICNKSVVKVLAVLRACQLGFLPRETLKDACSRQDYSGVKMIPVEELYLMVCERLPDFDKENRV